jgi:hypothetical protein
MSIIKINVGDRLLFLPHGDGNLISHPRMLRIVNLCCDLFYQG